MTEKKWCRSKDPVEMLRFLIAREVSSRRLALFCIEACRRDEIIMGDEERGSRQAVIWSEKLIEGLAQPDDDDEDAPTTAECYLMAGAANRCMAVATDSVLGEDSRARRYALECAEMRLHGAEESVELATLLRDIFGNPFRPVAVDPAWRTEAAVGIARGIYDDRAFERMPILADALQEAGCENAELLAHCREPGVHVRGCWVVDLVLGKG